jgi:hypothetical protein
MSSEQKMGIIRDPHDKHYRNADLIKQLSSQSGGVLWKRITSGKHGEYV